MIDNSEITRKREKIVDNDNQISHYLHSQNPVFIINRKGTFTNLNDAFCKKLGVNSDSIIGRNIGDVTFLTEESRKQARVRNVSRLLGKESPHYNIDIITANGDITSLKIDTKPIIKRGRVIGEIGIAQKIRKNFDYNDNPTFEVQRKSHHDMGQLQNEIDNIREKLELRESELYDVKQELRKSHLTFEKKSSNEEVEKKQEELKSIIEELRSRNKIIDQLKNQLTENQENVVEKNGMLFFDKYFIIYTIIFSEFSYYSF